MDKASVANEYNCSAKSKNEKLDEFCLTKFDHPCQLFHPPPFSQNLKWIMYTCCAVALVVLIIGIRRIYKIWIKHKIDIDGWPWKIMLWKDTQLERFKCLPHRLIYTFILIKVLIAIPVDFIDVIADLLYYYQITSSYSAEASCHESASIIDRRIAFSDSIYWILFAVMLTGVLKNIMLVQIAFQKIRGRHKLDPMMMPTRLRRVDLNESILLDKNAYMEFTFLQGVFAFILQDAVAAFVQFQYVDKYLVHLNFTVFINATLMSVTALRLMYLFTQYILQYWDSSDRLSLKVLHSIMLFTHSSVVVFQTTRAMVLIFSHGFTAAKVLTPIECFKYDEQRGLFSQTPMAPGCWSTVDYIFTGSIILAALGVMTCISLLVVNGYDQFKIFNQSQNFTRTAIVFHAPIQGLEDHKDPRSSRLMNLVTKKWTRKLDTKIVTKKWTEKSDRTIEQNLSVNTTVDITAEPIISQKY